MTTKGTASKSVSGMSMSQYDIEVEKRLQALEAQAHTPCGGDAATSEKRIAELEAKLDDLIYKLGKKMSL